MNYMREINAFYDQQETNPLSSSAIALWHALMHICNKAGWPVDFSVAVSVLSIKAGLKERTVYLARNELKQKGYITFQSKKGNQSAVYKLRSLSANIAGNHADKYTRPHLSAKYAGNDEDSHAHSGADRMTESAATLVKQNKTKQNSQEEKESPNPHQFFEANGFGTLSPLVAEDINDWLDGGYFDEPERIVTEAMKQAVLNNARNWKYVSRILMDWSNRQLKTMRDVQAYQAGRQVKNSNIATFKPRSKGNDVHDTHQSLDRPDYAGYDFGF